MTTNGRTASLSQEAYERIKQKIVSLELPPGEVIDEGRLQVDLGLGRTPIREALKRLALEKLVNIIPRRGMFVTDIGVRDLQHLFELRLELESLAARLAARRGTAEHWRDMAAALAALPPDEEQVDNETMIAIDHACHKIIYEATGNEFLQDTLNTMYTLSLRLWYFGLTQMGSMRRAVLEHRGILAALESRNADLAAELTQLHIRAFQEEIQAMILGRSDQ